MKEVVEEVVYFFFFFQLWLDIPRAYKRFCLSIMGVWEQQLEELGLRHPNNAIGIKSSNVHVLVWL